MATYVGGAIIGYEALIVLVVVLAVLPFVWLHNASLNTYRTYLELKEIKEILRELKNK